MPAKKKLTELKTPIPGRQTPRFIPVCWADRDGKVYWSKMAKVEKQAGRSIARFDDGAWNPLEDCFLTVEQLRASQNRQSARQAEQLQSVAETIEYQAKRVRLLIKKS